MQQSLELFHILSPKRITGKGTQAPGVTERLGLGQAMAEAGYNVAVLQPLPVPRKLNDLGYYEHVRTDDYDRFVERAVAEIPGCRVLPLPVAEERYVEWARDVAVFLGGQTVLVNDELDSPRHPITRKLQAFLHPGFTARPSFFGEGGRTFCDSTTLFASESGRGLTDALTRLTGHIDAVHLPKENTMRTGFDTDHIDIYAGVVPVEGGRLFISDQDYSELPLTRRVISGETRKGNEVAVTPRQNWLVPNCILPMPDGRVIIPDVQFPIRPQIEQAVGRTNILPIGITPNPNADKNLGAWRCSFTTLPLNPNLLI